MKFSPIFGPKERPEHKGWYSSSCSYYVVEFLHKKTNLKVDKHSVNFWYFDGFYWRLSDKDDSHLAISQDRYWFGIAKE